MQSHETVDTLERERERESYFLRDSSVFCMENIKFKANKLAVIVQVC